LGEWEFASEVIPNKVVGDRCRSSRVNQSILNGLLNLNLTDKQAKDIKVPFVQDMYEQTNEIAETQENTHNGFNYIFSDNSDIKPTHYKAKYIHKLW
ncbi:21451_t:CDS:2, partial [Racocetra persica]